MAETLLDEVIANATPVERIVQVCVSGNLVAEQQRLTRELEDAQWSTSLGDSEQKQKAQRLRDIEQQMQSYTYDFRFRALSAKAWSDLLSAYPDPQGRRAFDPDAFPQAAIGACCVEPEGLGEPDKMQRLMDTLSPAQQMDLFDGAWSVNTDAPLGKTSSIASDILKDSGTSSSSATGTESPEAGSSGSLGG